MFLQNVLFFNLQKPPKTCSGGRIPSSCHGPGIRSYHNGNLNSNIFLQKILDQMWAKINIGVKYTGGQDGVQIKDAPVTNQSQTPIVMPIKCWFVPILISVVFSVIFVVL